MAEDETEEVDKEVDKAEEEGTNEVVEEVAENTKIGFTSHISPVTLNMNKMTHYRRRQEKG